MKLRLGALGHTDREVMAARMLRSTVERESARITFGLVALSALVEKIVVPLFLMSLTIAMYSEPWSRPLDALSC